MNAHNDGGRPGEQDGPDNTANNETVAALEERIAGLEERIAGLEERLSLLVAFIPNATRLTCWECGEEAPHVGRIRGVVCPCCGTRSMVYSRLWPELAALGSPWAYPEAA